MTEVNGVPRLLRIAWAAIGATAMLLGARSVEAQGIGYGVAGLGGVSGFFLSRTTLHAAGGGELLFRDRAGVSGEFGFFGTGRPLLMGSANGVFHVVRAGGNAASPFVTAGWTRMGNGDASFDAWNAGAGVDLWSKERLGLRIEFRDHVRPDFRGTVHYWTFRGGIAFR